MSKPTVSIITPSYNQGGYIEDTILSVKNQNYKDIEHIIVDGASTDETVEILSKYQNRYQMKWISEPDNGQANAINKGFEMAEGEILGWLNSDDVYITQTAISDLVNSLTDYPEADLVNGKGIRLHEDGKWSHPIKRRNHKISYSDLKKAAFVLQPATLWYRYVWEDITINESLDYTFDWDFFIRASEVYNIIPISNYIIGYRWQGDNKTTTGDLERAQEIRYITGKYLGLDSWQYHLLSLYCGIYRISNRLPDPIGGWMKSGLDIGSSVISYITLKQVSGV